VKKYERKSDLSRSWAIDVFASGHIQIRRSGTRISPGALPVFSTHTEEHAHSLVVKHCRKLYRQNQYILNEPPKDVDDLVGVADMFRESYNKICPVKNARTGARAK
jgi:hypothetical protein